jgi:hypothetical protein
MSWRRTDALTTVRREGGPDSRRIAGLAVPYGVQSLPTMQLDGASAAEAFAPGAFSASVEHWNGRQDGARMAFRPAHGERPVGTVRELRDTPAGVEFAAEIFESPAGDEYLRDVDAGLNGVSIEWGPGSAPSRKMRGGQLLHREGRMHAIAGSLQPAYDGARVALRDMEDPMDPNTTNDAGDPPAQPAAPAAAERSAAEATTVTPTMTQAERSAAESDAARHVQPTITRPEAIYGPRSGHSFFADRLHASEGDGEAADRLNRHAQLLAQQVELMERAGDVLSSEVPGAYPNTYLPGLLTPRILKGRPMGGFFSRVTITDATPRIFPKVTTSTTVTVQAAEGTNPAASDLATTAVTATPLLYGGSTDVSRQVLDGADPSIDSMLMQDLVEAYAQASETVIKTAVEAGATASGVGITAATPYAGELANVINYQATRFSPAEGVFIPSALYSVLLAQGDTTGRPFLPMIGGTNADGTVAPGGATAGILGADAYLSWASTANVNVFARRSDYVIFESSIAQFRYDQVVGPAAIRIGIWAYLVVGTRLGGLKVTAA